MNDDSDSRVAPPPQQPSASVGPTYPEQGYRAPPGGPWGVPAERFQAAYAPAVPAAQAAASNSIYGDSAGEYLRMERGRYGAWPHVVIGFGVAPKPEFWLGPHDTGDGFRESHIAFVAPNRAAVDAFFAAAVETGAEILHAPRVWPEYHPNYYGAFVRDPDGNNVEAVCHSPDD